MSNGENGLWVFGNNNYFERNVALHNVSYDLYDVGSGNTYVKNVFGSEGP
jgi:hypothetical protein